MFIGQQPYFMPNLRDRGQRVGMRMLHHLADSLLDQFAIGQPGRVGLGQFLLDGQLLLR